MYRNLIVLAFVLMSFALRAQFNVYHEFPDSNAVWNISAQGCCWADCGGPPSPNPVVADHLFSYYINGDTIIDSISYHKLYKSGSTHTHCASPTSFNSWTYYDDYFLAFREDTALRKVFWVGPSSTTEYLWYDFSAGVGDTICPWDPCTVVSSIDSIQIGSTFRKRFNLANPAVFYIIEGIGSNAGPMEPACPFEYWASLVCFTQEGQTLYPDTVTTCDLITYLPDQPILNAGISVVPNPTSDYSTLYFGRSLQNATLTVINALGQTVVQLSNINGASVLINRNGLDNGLYMLQVTENNDFVGSARVIFSD